MLIFALLYFILLLGIMYSFLYLSFYQEKRNLKLLPVSISNRKSINCGFSESKVFKKNRGQKKLRIQNQIQDFLSGKKS